MLMSVKPRHTEARRARRQGRYENWVTWRHDAFRELECPACRKTGVMSKTLDASPPFKPEERIDLFECPACGTMHYPDTEVFEYESRRDADLARKFYIEIGAGLDAMISPLHWVASGEDTAYLEVGGGYGFALDYAVRGLGWRGVGLDPSRNARTGSADLGLDVRDAYLTADQPPSDGPFDRIMASEVIEHVSDPDSFLAAIAGALADDGVALLTTPDAAMVRSTMSEGVLAPILAPSHHLILFTVDGLEAALERAGFSHVTVEARGGSLWAAASRRAFEVDFSAGPDGDTLARYLETRRDAVTADPVLSAGFAWRLVKHLVNLGRYEDAEIALRPVLAHLQREYGITLDQADRIDPVFQPARHKERGAVRAFAGNYPFFLPILVYLAGRIAEAKGETETALSFYACCIRITPVFVRVLAGMYAGCRETEATQIRARLHMARLNAQRDADAAVAQMLAAAPEAGRLTPSEWRAAQLQVFADAVLSGHADAVEPLAAAASLILDETPHADWTGFERAASAALGHRALRLRRWSDAAQRFDAARRASEDEAETKRLVRWRNEAASAALIEAMRDGDVRAAAEPASLLSDTPPEDEAVSASAANAMGLYRLNAPKTDGQMGGETGGEAAPWFERAMQDGEARDRIEAEYHRVLALARDGSEALEAAARALLDVERPDSETIRAQLGSRLQDISGYVSVSDGEI